MLVLWLYNALWIILILPMAFLRLLWRSRHFSGYRQGWLERLGYIGYRKQEGMDAPVWFHMVSFGEVRAAIPLIRAFHTTNPTIPLVLTTMTLTGRQALQQAFGEIAFCAYVPYDSWGSVRRFLNRVSPQKGVVLETEIWPTLFYQVAQRNIPLFLVNARISPAAMVRYRWIRSWLLRFLAPVVIATQSEADNERFHELGAKHAKTVGNIKYDIQLQAELPSLIMALKAQLGARPIWVAASTHEGEDAQVLAAHGLILQLVPNALLILVPRHPERFAQVATLCQEQGFAVIRRSEKKEVPPSSAVFLGDTMGEMLTFMGCASAVFVGGSLVPIGGHNTLEPAALALPICVGPYTNTFEEVTGVLKSAGGLFRVDSAESLGSQIGTWLSQPETAAAVGQKAHAAFSANKGAVARLVNQISLS